MLAAYVEAMESGKLALPDDVHDKAAWDHYWNNQLQFGPFQQGFSDMMSSEPSLVELLDRRGVRTVLCAGIGCSLEALALALHGFDVTALDLSEVPWTFVRMHIYSGNIRLLPGFEVAKGDLITLPPLSDQTVCPAIHRSPSRPARGGGSLLSVTGDLADPAICPGPFDAVIERRTVQLFPPTGRSAALDRLAARLAPRGLLLSHEHCGGGRPGAARDEWAADWARTKGFLIDPGPDLAGTAERVAILRYSTG